MKNSPRDLALDNLRALMVLAILLLHAACAYAFAIPWWHARDENHMAFDLLLLIIDTFALPVLFFISGTFARQSFERHGTTGFVRAKLIRLGLPVLVLSSLYLPPMVYMGYLRRAADPVGFFQYWLNWMSTLGDWGFHLFTSMETGAKYQDAFSPHHLWFVSMLLVFFLGYALVRPGARKPVHESTPPTGLSMLVCFLAATLGFTAVNTVVQDWAWARLGPFLLFQPTRVPVYLAMFIFGVLVRDRMVRPRPLPGSPWLWCVAFISLLALFVPASSAFMNASGPPEWPMALAHGALRCALAVAAICLCANLGKRFLDTAGAWKKSLAASSYDIYLLHMPLTVFAQAALVAVAAPLGLKMLLAFASPAGLCWWLSRIMAAHGPWLKAALLAAYFLVFCLACS